MQTPLTLGKTDSTLGLGNISVLDAATLPRHRWYHIKEAFSPNVVSRAIEDSNCVKDDLIIDPFCGSGTVPLTAAIEGFSSIAFEVNPFLKFVSETKLLQCKSKTIKKNCNDILFKAKKGKDSSLEAFSTFSEAGKSPKWLFNREVLRSFEGGWEATLNKRKPVQKLIQLCLIGAVMDVANATKDGKCLRYRSDWKSQNFGKKDFINAFNRRIDIIIKDLEDCPIETKDVFVSMLDSRRMQSSNLRDKKFKLCVMSPPYLNSFDYTDVYRPELFLGKFINSGQELRELRQKTLRSHVQAKWVDPEQVDFGPNFTESFEQIKERSETLWNKRLPLMIQAYFEDIKQVLIDLKALSKPDANIWIVVSTSAYAGVEIPVDLIIADIGTQAGWWLREVSVIRHLRRVPVQQWALLNEEKKNGPYLRESIIIFEKSLLSKND